MYICTENCCCVTTIFETKFTTEVHYNYSILCEYGRSCIGGTGKLLAMLSKMVLYKNQNWPNMPMKVTGWAEMRSVFEKLKITAAVKNTRNTPY
jgi:hypothetical protein